MAFPTRDIFAVNLFIYYYFKKLVHSYGLVVRLEDKKVQSFGALYLSNPMTGPLRLW